MFNIEKRKKFDRYFPIIWTILITLSVGGASAYYYLAKNKPVAEIPETKVAETVSTEEPKESSPEPEAIEEVAKTPPKRSTSSKIVGKPISTAAGTATAVSTGGDLTTEEVAKLSAYSTMGAASSITYTDTTGRYPELGDTLKSYINNNLLHTTELGYMYEIRIVDCSGCNYSGLYTGSYLQSGSDIYKAYGYITLNALPYKDSTRFLDYMKLILAHEYGHHYTLYHRWVDLDIPAGQRFPDSYYTTRPLAKSTTTYDYSLGWENCDAEIIAEDYSYFYSGYNYHGMSDVYGYPSNPGTKNWLINIAQAVSTTQEATSENTTIADEPSLESSEGSEPVTPTATTDAVLPQVSILKPADGVTVSGNFEIQVSASDDVRLQKIELFFDSYLLISIERSFIGTMDSTRVSNGVHVIKAIAYDSSSNKKETSITITVDNPLASEKNPKKN